MTTKLGTPIADFETQLATQLDPGGTTATLQSATDDDAVALPAGKYFFTLDLSNSVKEHIVCNLSGTALTNIKSISRQGVQTTGAARKHRIGSSVTITDWAHIKYMNDLLSGATQFDSSVPFAYDGVATLTPGSNQFATVLYADALAIAGSPDATTTQKGIQKISVAPASAASPISVGDNDPRVPTQGENDAMVGNNTDIAVGSGNKMVTQTGLQHGAEKYAADAGSNDTYVITLSPVPTSYTTGMVVHFKANTINTGAATLNVNSLGAKTIVKGVSTTLVDGDIAAGQFCTVIYDGTNFVLQNPTKIPVRAASGTQAFSSSTTYTITTGFRPTRITLFYAEARTFSMGGYDATTGTMWNIQNSYEGNGGVLGGSFSTSAAFTFYNGTNGTGTSAIINNITDTGFDIVVTKGSQNCTPGWEAIG